MGPEIRLFMGLSLFKSEGPSNKTINHETVKQFLFLLRLISKKVRIYTDDEEDRDPDFHEDLDYISIPYLGQIMDIIGANEANKDLFIGKGADTKPISLIEIELHDDITYNSLRESKKVNERFIHIDFDETTIASFLADTKFYVSIAGETSSDFHLLSSLNTKYDQISLECELENKIFEKDGYQDTYSLYALDNSILTILENWKQMMANSNRFLSQSQIKTIVGYKHIWC